MRQFLIDNPSNLSYRFSAHISIGEIEMRNGLILFITTLLLTSCINISNNHLQATADAMTACEKIKTLVKAHNNSFDGIKGQLVSARYMNIWDTRVNAVGNNCQIWQTGNNHTTYVCTQLAPNEAIAIEWFKQSTNTINLCLNNWKLNSQSRKDGPGQVFRWSQPLQHTTVSAHVFPTRGIFKDHWVIYYFVGNRDDRF